MRHLAGMRNVIAIILIASLAGLAMLAFAQSPAGGRRPSDTGGANGDSSKERFEMFTGSKGEAKKLLATYRTIWKSEHPAEDVSESDWALGYPFPLLVLDFDDINRRSFVNGAEVFSHGPNEIIYPVWLKQKNETRLEGAIHLRKDTSGWVLVSYGSRNVAQLLVEARHSDSRKNKINERDYWAVNVTSIDHFFLAYKRDNDVWMIPLVSRSTPPEWKAGVALETPRLLQMLREISNHVNPWVTEEPARK